MSFVVFNCRSCGAAIEVQPDNLLTVCEHCGTVYPSKELGDIPVHIVPSSSEEAVCSEVLDRMRQDRTMKRVASKLSIERADGVYVPLFIQRARVRGRWKGFRKKKQGDKTVTIWKDGDIDHDGDFPVLARKHAHEFGLPSLGRVVFGQRPEPFAQVTWTDARLPVLSVDIDEHHADLAVEDDLIDKLGASILRQHRLDTITEFDVDVHIEDRFILLYPLWTVMYTFRKGSYRVAVAGGRRPRVLAAMEPIFLGRRLLHLLLGAAGILGVGLLWPMVWVAFSSGDDDIGEVIAVLLTAMVACLWLALRTADQLSASVQVDRLGEEESLFS